MPSGSKVTAAAVSDGKLWLGMENGAVSVMNIPGGESACPQMQPYKKSITAMASVGSSVWVASLKGTAKLIDKATFKQTQEVNRFHDHFFYYLFKTFLSLSI